MVKKKWVYTENSKDPCSYDVQWRPVNPDEEEGMDVEMEPYWPDGSIVPKIFNGIHIKCGVYEYEH